MNNACVSFGLWDHFVTRWVPPTHLQHHEEVSKGACSPIQYVWFFSDWTKMMQALKLVPRELLQFAVVRYSASHKTNLKAQIE